MVEQVTTTGAVAAQSAAAATSSDASQRSDGEVATLEPTDAATLTAVSVDITQQVWCAGLGPEIRDAHQEAIYVWYANPAGLADAIEELHRFYRVAAAGRPSAIATDVASINRALDELEPVLRPVGWESSLIDRSTIADADSAYIEAAMAIGQYNTDVCGLEPAGQPDYPVLEAGGTVQQEAPQPAGPDTPLSDCDVALFVKHAEASGMTTEEAACFVNMFVSGDTDGDLTEMVFALFDCGFDPDRLEELGVVADEGVQITSPDNPRTEEEVEEMTRVVEQKGMTRLEAECHVGAYLDVTERGGETAAALEKLLGCGLTVERMEELGLFAGCPWRPNICTANG